MMMTVLKPDDVVAGVTIDGLLVDDDLLF